MQKRKQKGFLKKLEKITLSLIFSLGFLTLLIPFGAVKAEEEESFPEEPGGAPNSIFIKNFKADYNSEAGAINGEAEIINLGNQSFHNLNYTLTLLAYGEGADLGTEVHEEIIDNNFSIAIQGEVKKSFSYEIPKGVPSGEYNFLFQVIDSRGRQISFDFYPFSYSNDAGSLLAVNPESVKIEVNGEDYLAAEGIATKKDDKVKLKFELENNKQETVSGIIPHLVVYPYSTSFEKVAETDLDSLSLNAGEKKEFSFILPPFSEPQSYLAVLELKKDSEAIALPIRGRWVVEGIQGKIFTSGIDVNGNLLLEVVGSPYSLEEEGKAAVKITDKNGNVCFAGEKSINDLGLETRSISLSSEFSEQCPEPIIEADLAIKGQTVDHYKEKLEIGQGQVSTSQSVFPDKKTSSTLTKFILLGLVIIISLILISLLISRSKKKNDNLSLLLLFLLPGLLLFSLLFSVKEAKAWKADAGHYLNIGNYSRVFTYPPSQTKIERHQLCLNAKNNYCFVGSRLGRNSRTHVQGFYQASWHSPSHNQNFNVEEDIECLVTNINNWCLNGWDVPTTIKWNVFPRETAQKDQVIRGGTINLGAATTRTGWSVGSLPPGKYAIYLNIYYPGVLLFHGMIRYFEVGGPPAQCGAANDQYFNLDNQPSEGSLCESGEPSDVSFNDTAWTWNWTCSGGTVEACQAYKNAQCSPTNGQYLNGAPTDNLCSVGDEVGDVSFDGAKWSWSCKANESSASCEAYKDLRCRLEPDKSRFCPGDNVTVNVKDLIPSKDNARLSKVSWEIPGVGFEEGDRSSSICDSFSPDFSQVTTGNYNINYQVTDIGGEEAGCFTSVYVKNANCNIVLDPSTELTIGSTVKLKINTECLTPAAENPYILRVLLQGTPDDSSYEYSQADLYDDGEVSIKIKKAGTFTFEANVNGENGITVGCSSQASAFTEGSEWWERRPE